MVTADINTRDMDIREDMIICTIAKKYRPEFILHFCGYTYKQKEIIQLSIDTAGNVKVFGAHTLTGTLRFTLTYVLR